MKLIKIDSTHMKNIRTALILALLLASNLLFAQNAKFVSGKVTDIKTKEFVEKAEFIIQNADSSKIYEAETSSEGVFTFQNIPLGEYTLVVSDKDYNRQDIPFSLDESHAAGYTFTTFEIGRKVSWMFNWGDAGETEHYWSHLTAKFIIAIYFVCLLLVLFYSVLQVTLAITYVKNKKKKKNQELPVFDANNTPKVTIQLPMYNELYVADRIIETVAKFDYPSDKFQIQVLDDSTDETKDVIAKKVSEVAATGINIQHIHRTDRTGYKAGALDDAMDSS